MGGGVTTAFPTATSTLHDSCQITFFLVALTFVALSFYELGFQHFIPFRCLQDMSNAFQMLHIACLPWRCFTFKHSDDDGFDHQIGILLCTELEQ